MKCRVLKFVDTKIQIYEDEYKDSTSCPKYVYSKE